MESGTVRKKIDARVRSLIEAGVRQRHRSLVVVVGDRGRDQIVNLHYMLSKAQVRSRPSVLWCYRDDLGFSTHKKKRMKQIQKKVHRGLQDPNEDNPFELFVASTDIRYTFYKDTHKVLGQTFGMCVLQDFEALTPNILARTIETVEGGGLVVVLLRTLTSLRQLYSMTMDFHDRLRTESHQAIRPRFNERFLLSLGANPACLVLDDELNVLPLSASSTAGVVQALHPTAAALQQSAGSVETDDDRQLRALKDSLSDTELVGQLVAAAKTVDQARALLLFIEAIADKSLRTTVALTAARGRGKSAALGLAIAAAVASGYANIFVTSPTPENLRTLFEFVLKGFDCLEYVEHADYEILRSLSAEQAGAVVRINVFREHRQTVQYVAPGDAASLAQAELLVVDEAAAIPLPLVQRMLGPYLVFLSSTVNGYEGTGRSLSLKLISQLRQQSIPISTTPLTSETTTTTTTKELGNSKSSSTSSKEGIHTPMASSSSSSFSSSLGGGRQLKEIVLNVPIRYASGDPVEKWLNGLLCLDVGSDTNTAAAATTASSYPFPKDCTLYYVNRDTLFSYHTASERFLQNMMALMVSAHYRNSPNDLLLMADAPAHHLFVLLGPVQQGAAAMGRLPDVLCVVQVCVEGGLQQERYTDMASRGERAAGDMIPWLLASQYQQPAWSSLTGVRVVRIATHPEHQRMGYGSRALQLLLDYYSGFCVPAHLPPPAHSSFSEKESVEEEKQTKKTKKKENESRHSSSHALVEGGGSLKEEEAPTPRTDLPPLLLRLEERSAETVDWFGTSFGLTSDLFRFWQRGQLRPAYVRQTVQELTAEHSCVMVRALRPRAEALMAPMLDDFAHRFEPLLPLAFRSFPLSLVLSVLRFEPVHEAEVASLLAGAWQPPQPSSRPWRLLTPADRAMLFPYADVERLDAYARGVLDYHAVLDLVPVLARLLMARRLPVPIHFAQAAVLVGLGLQGRSLEDLADHLSLQVPQVLALLVKTVRKAVAALNSVLPHGPSNDRGMDEEDKNHGVDSHPTTEASDTKPSAKTPAEVRRYQEKMAEGQWESTLGRLAHVGGEVPSMVSVKRARSSADIAEEQAAIRHAAKRDKSSKEDSKHSPSSKKMSKKVSSSLRER